MNKKLYDSIITMSNELEVEPLKLISKTIDLTRYTKSFNEILEIVEYLITSNKSKPSSINSGLLNDLCYFNIEGLRNYYNILEEKDKIKLISKIERPLDLVNSNILNDTKNKGSMFFIGGPTNVYMAIIPVKCWKDEDIQYTEWAKNMYNNIDNNFSFYFKYLDFSKISNFSAKLEYILPLKRENNYFVDTIIKRLSFYKERRIGKEYISMILDSLKNPYIDKDVKKDLTIAIEKYIPEKILVDLQL